MRSSINATADCRQTTADHHGIRKIALEDNVFIIQKRNCHYHESGNLIIT
jgi:hypothetical protein